MNVLFQFAIFSFVVFSFLLVIGVPVVFANSSNSSNLEENAKNKTTLYFGISLWFLLIFVVGILNSFVT